MRPPSCTRARFLHKLAYNRALHAMLMARDRSRAASPRSLKVSDAFKSFVLDQLADTGDVTSKSMFGGVGLYCDGVFFGIIARDVLYLKVDDSNRADFERARSRPFKPYPDRPGTMQYYEVPVDVLESLVDLTAWARKSVSVAARAGRK
jgi:DNA transformation protein and related proteins